MSLGWYRICLFRNIKTNEQYPADGFIMLDDDFGQVTIRLMDAQVKAPAINEAEDIVGIQQHEQIFVRGYVSTEGVFSSTYFTSGDSEGKVEDAVEIQLESFVKDVRQLQKAMGGCFLFFIVPILFLYPLYEHHTLWEMEMSHVVTDKYEDVDAYYLYFEEWPTRLMVSGDLYNACDIDAVVHKASNTLDFGCTGDPSSLFVRNYSILGQLWHNVGTIILLIFLGILSTVSRSKKTTTRPE